MDLLVGIMLEWLELVSLASCIGVLVCSAWVALPGRAHPPREEDALLAGMGRMLRVALAGLLASSALGLVASSAEMSGQPMARVLPVLPTVLLHTHLGHTWILRMAAIVALAATAIATRRSRHPRLSSYVMLACAIVVSAMDSASGHASDAGDFSVAEILDWAHLLAAMVWGGGLLVLSIVVLPRLAAQGDPAARSFAAVATRFSTIAGVAVGFIVLTAPYQAWAHGGTVEALVTTSYGRTVVAKIVLLVALLVLGALNRFVAVPRLQEWAGSATPRTGALGRLLAPTLRSLVRDADGRLAAARFARAVRIEALLVVAVLLCAALLRHEEPAHRAARLEHHAMDGSAGGAAAAGEGAAGRSFGGAR